MSVFTPSGRFTLGRVPWDNSYRHARTWSNKQEQYEGIAALMTATIPENNYTYIRKDNVVKVQANYETIYAVNYCMYQNSNYGAKWFYAFVTNIEYINENTTALTIETDVLQTWYFNYDRGVRTFIERMHSPTDIPGDNLVPEPEMSVRPVVLKSQDILNSAEYKIVLQETSKPDLLKMLDPDWKDAVVTGNSPCAGGVYNGVYSGAKYYAFPMESGESTDQVRLWLNWLSSGGGMDGLVNMFLFPAAFLPPVGDDHGVQENTDAKLWHLLIEPPTVEDVLSIKDYQPKNNKVFTFPFTFLRLVQVGGGSNDYRYEWFNYNTAVEHSAYFECYVPLDADANLIMFPMGYAGCDERDYENAFFMPITTKLSWTSSTYDTWSAQNFLSQALSVTMAGLSLALPYVGTVSKAVGALSGGIKSATAMKGVSAGGKAGSMGRITAKAGDISESISAGALMDALTNTADYVGTAARMALTPNKQCGSYTGNGLYSVGALVCRAQTMVPCIDDLKAIDSFFSMYGYAYDRLDNINITSRKYWNYIKTSNVEFAGAVPTDDLKKISAIYNNGVTFWHTNSIGQYGLNNEIV